MFISLTLYSLVAETFSSACMPWSDSPCTRWRDQFDFRWFLRQEGQEPTEDVFYRIPATVDEIQRFQLNNTAFIATMNSTINPLTQREPKAYDNFMEMIYHAMRTFYILSDDPTLVVSYFAKPAFLSLFGTGSRVRPEVPLPNDYGTVQVYEPRCPECNHGPAIVSMLVFNVTLKEGKFHYAKNSTPPVGVGFHPTCTRNDICKMDATMHCIGRSDHRNCAVCLDPNKPADIVGRDITIFTTYYGTDAKGHRLMSGSSNPLNFRQLAVDAVYNKISRDIGLLGETLKSLNPFSDEVANNAFEGKAKVSK